MVIISTGDGSVSGKSITPENSPSKPSSGTLDVRVEKSRGTHVIMTKQLLPKRLNLSCTEEEENTGNNTLSDNIENAMIRKSVSIEEDSIHSFDLDTACDETWYKEQLSEWMENSVGDIWVRDVANDTHEDKKMNACNSHLD